ncbi:hypothetical protein GOP47_0012130 [Adiantum capillus-veneris]|uniref:Uncharacterized protein n=1 Tax=Adiantum capillus-veneris TaxID=13818 RepID=A0A9D4ZE66_ADICA|nr:hypothetical protein GOP47_0012130 [Adiantum capillus-veneris]
MSVLVVEDQPDIGQVLEDNVLALLDTVGVKNAEDIEDDKMSFIEAVYALCIAGSQPKAPTRNVHEAVFHLLEGNHSSVLNMASYSLLIDIAEDFVSLLNDLQEAFGQKPWAQSTEMGSIEMEKCLSHKVTGLILKFQYLFKIVEHDFQCWFQAYKVIKKDEIMSDCYLLRLFQGSNAKPLLESVFNLIALLSTLWKGEDKSLSFQELSLSLQALVEMRLLYDLESKQLVHASPRKTRVDPSRSLNFMELFTIAFQFNKELLKTLLQVMEDSECKLKIIFANFLKDIPKPLAAERISDPNNMTTQELLDCLKDVNSARIVHRVSDCDVLQVFLASAFKADLRHTKSHHMEQATIELCKALKTAFQNLQSISKEFNDLHPAARQALVTAETMLALAT